MTRVSFEDEKKAWGRALEAKNDWFLRKVVEAQTECHGGDCVKVHQGIERGRRKLVSKRSTVVRDKEENTCTTLIHQQQRWRRHFTKVLNVQSNNNSFVPRTVPTWNSLPVTLFFFFFFS